MILDLDRGHKPNTRFKADIAFVMEIAWAVAADAISTPSPIRAQQCRLRGS